jgi:O-glycosyl hydrolase
MTYWMTEFNAWCSGCDEGKVGIYDYNYSSNAVKYLLEFLANNATACLVWEGYDSYYEHHAPSTFSWWGILEYNQGTKTYAPRKNLYAISQVSKYVLPGSWRISVSEVADSVKVLAFYNPASPKVTIVGLNQKKSPVELKVALANLPDLAGFDLIYTDSSVNLHKAGKATVIGKSFETVVPANCIFTLVSIEKK